MNPTKYKKKTFLSCHDRDQNSSGSRCRKCVANKEALVVELVVFNEGFILSFRHHVHIVQ